MCWIQTRIKKKNCLAWQIITNMEKTMKSTMDITETEMVSSASSDFLPDWLRHLAESCTDDELDSLIKHLDSDDELDAKEDSGQYINKTGAS